MNKVSKFLRWLCLKCWLRKSGIGNGIRLKDNVVATLYDENGKVLKVIKGHNKWTLVGLSDMIGALATGAAVVLDLKITHMQLGSQNSDTAFTLIAGSERTTSNTVIGDVQVKFTANWLSAEGPYTGIHQACIRQRMGATPNYFDAAYYNFGSAFDKPTGVALKIEWTTTAAS